jgi:hypothetical protein
VTTDGGAAYLGNVGSLSPDSVQLRDDQDREIFFGSLSSLGRVEVFQGQRTDALLGLVGGAALGLAAGFVICSLGETCSLLFTNDIRPEVIGLSGAVGLLVGLLVGSRNTHDVWADIPIERLRVAVSQPASASIYVGIALRL